jgi:hypothetical protein
MPVRARSTVPAIKDRSLIASAPSATPQNLFFNPWYDYQVVSVVALAQAVIAPGPIPFLLGYSDYTDSNGAAVPANHSAYLSATTCIDSTGAIFGTNGLPLGGMSVILLQLDPQGLGLNIIRAGSALVLTGTGANILINVIVRPKDLDRGDASKRPFGASDEAYATYYK